MKLFTLINNKIDETIRDLDAIYAETDKMFDEVEALLQAVLDEEANKATKRARLRESQARAKEEANSILASVQ
jgi:hypothetical protein